MKMKSLRLTLAILALATLSFPSIAAAKDAVWSKINCTHWTGTAPWTGAPNCPEWTGGTNSYVGATPEFILNNGNPYSSGTFAVGTIQLLYIVDGTEFPSGPFGSFKLDMGINISPNTGQATRYTVDPLLLEQVGSKNIVLNPVLSSFPVTGQGWTGSSVIGISIDPSVHLDDSLNCDGCELVANLRMTTPGGSHLDTVTNVQVHIKLVHPHSCVRLFNFLTDQAFTTVVNSTIVNLGGPANNKKVTGTNPFGQFSDNVLVVNNCATAQTFDLGTTMDSHFEFGPGGANANAVFTFMTNTVVDPSQFNVAVWGTGTGVQKNLFLSNITLPAGSSFLVRVHMALIKGNAPSWLPATGLFDGFLAQMFTPGTPLNSLAPAIPFAMAVPNPATTQMGFTVR